MNRDSNRLEEVKEIIKTEPKPSKEAEPFAELEAKFATQQTKYTFILKTNKEAFAKGSQVYLTYGRWSNRDLLLHYGFSLEKNKYNYGFFKMGFHGELADARKTALFCECFGIDPDANENVALRRKFKIFYQQFHCCTLLSDAAVTSKKYSDFEIYKNPEFEADGLKRVHSRIKIFGKR